MSLRTRPHSPLAMCALCPPQAQRVLLSSHSPFPLSGRVPPALGTVVSQDQLSDSSQGLGGPACCSGSSFHATDFSRREPTCKCDSVGEVWLSHVSGLGPLLRGAVQHRPEHLCNQRAPLGLAARGRDGVSGLGPLAASILATHARAPPWHNCQVDEEHDSSQPILLLHKSTPDRRFQNKEKLDDCAIGSRVHRRALLGLSRAPQLSSGRPWRLAYVSRLQPASLPSFGASVCSALWHLLHICP